MSVRLFYVTPFLALLSVNAIANLAHSPANWITFAAAFACGAAAFFALQPHLMDRYTQGTVHLRGEPFTLIFLMIMFWSNFADGFLTDVAPQAASSLSFTLIFSALLGLCSGSFTGRSARVLKNASR